VSQTAADLLAKAVTDLKPALADQAARDARILLGEALGVERGRLTLILQDVVSAQKAARFAGFVAQRMQRQPVSQIIGRRAFWGRNFAVNADVLDPRPETETLVSAALQSPAATRILDLGVGSGCILLTLLAEWPEALGVGADLSAAALATAALNAKALEVSDRAVFVESDWFSNIDGVFDLVVSNPPYISEFEMAQLQPEVALWEPPLALTPGGDGLAAYRALAQELNRHLAENGQALFEIGKDQAVSVCEIFKNAGFDKVSVLLDMNGHDRTLRVMRQIGRI